MQNCLNTNISLDELAGLLKAANYTTLFKCYLNWAPFLESTNATNAFITKRPVEIYNSDDPPILDTFFSIASQVFA